MDGAELSTESWLLAYEANFKAWLPNKGGAECVAADPAFGLLKNHGVYFYDQSAKASYGVWASQRAILPHAPPTLGGYGP